MRRGRLLIGLVLALVSAVGYFGLREFNPITGETQHISLTPEQEIALGLQSAPEMADQFGGLEPDASIQSDVSAIGGRLVQHTIAGQTPYRFSFSVLRDRETVNAFALPGGPIFITRGLLEKFDNEAQLAGVLSHEIGHVIARHSAEHIAKSQLAGGLINAVGTAGSDGAGGGNQAAQVAAVVAQMVQLKYGRSDEHQSDTLGVRLLAEAGYDPRALLEVMRILAESSGPRGQPEFLSSHPDPGNRKELIQGAIDARFPNGVPDRLTLGRQIAVAQ
ncbi:MAG: M48 family metalloprotease [Candidatus Eisenbacteria bacterium]